MKFTVAALPTALLIGQAVASALPGISLPNLDGLLRPRQSQVIDPSDIAPQCRNTCAVMVQAFNGCDTYACLCTNQVISGVADCLSCTINVGGPPDASLLNRAQEALNDLEGDCTSHGYSVGSYTISGGSVPASTSRAQGSSISIPAASGTGTPSVFFSTSGGPVGTPTVISPSATAPTVTQITLTSSAGGTITRQTVTSAPSSSAGSLNPSSSPSLPGAASTIGVSKLVVAGVVAGVMALFA